MNPTIRLAGAADTPRMVELSEQKRTDYERHQPTLWRKAEGSAALQQPYFERLVESDSVVALIHETDGCVDGFVIAGLGPAPPVYDPGGLTCSIDDFVVKDQTLWQGVGTALLSEVVSMAKDRGAVQIVVVCGHHDAPKRQMLSGIGLTIASEWWVDTI